ncbi:GRB10-interacting GYF protein 2-like [Rhincodon typus]|uniref:GRB10-interacting GYF protein 2-like n=1 Tax=Rhincodon typus TaxID=259920 RepID=UPI0020302FFD|nr:GRB10-interacting GYF protein 2-like [Rhincodon typus]
MEDGEERSNSEDSEKEEAKEPDKRTKEEAGEEANKTDETKDVSCTNSLPSPLESQIAIVASPPERKEKMQEKPDETEDAQQRPAKEVMDTSAPYQKTLIQSVNSTTTTAATTTTTVSSSPTITTVANRNIPQDNDDDEGLKHLEQLPSSSTWGQQSSSVSSQTQNTLPLAEIQKLEEERERQLREEQRRQQQELMKVLQQQNQQQKLTGWGNIPKTSVTTKSLLEIQQEEFRQMQKQQENKAQTRASAAVKLNLSAGHEESSFKNTITMKREEPSTKRIGSERNHHSSLPVSTTSVWGSVNTSPTNQWGTDVSSVWGAPDHKNTNVGFWDEAVKEVGPPARNQLSKSNKNNSNPGKSHGVQNKANKKAEEEEKLMKLFQGSQS